MTDRIFFLSTGLSSGRYACKLLFLPVYYQILHMPPSLNFRRRIVTRTTVFPSLVPSGLVPAVHIVSSILSRNAALTLRTRARP